jgi:nitroreductase
MSLIVDGYDPDDFVDLPDVRVNYDDFLTLLKTRRSKRHFTARSISDELWEKIIGAAVTAPVSVPPSNVEITILNGKSKVKAVLPSIVEELQKSMSDGKSDISPLVAGALQAWDEGEDYISYHSTGMMLFHADRGSDSYRENCTIAMTIAVLAAESLRLGCCIIGMISPALNRSTTAKNQLNIPETNDVIGAIILGHPIFRYRREIPRQFKSVSYV